MANTHRAFEIRIANDLLKIADLSHMFPCLNFSISAKGDSRRIVSSVFQAFQTLYDNFLRVIFRTYVSDNTAHKITS